MEIKTVFVKDKLLSDLIANINEAAALFTELLDVIKNQFPRIERNTDLLWILLQKNEVREYLCSEIAKNAAIKNGLNCEYDRTDMANLSQSTIFERRVNEATIAHELGIFKRISNLVKYDYQNGKLRHLQTYLRTGAIYVDADGWVTIATDSEKRLKAYCSVTVENKTEAAFVSKVEAMRDHVAKIKKLHTELADLAATDAGKDDISNSAYMEDRLLVGKQMRLSGDNAVWRSLVTFVTAHRTEDIARFFNSFAIPEYDVIDVYNRVGYLSAPTPGLRLKYPALYENVAFRGSFGSSPFDEDTPEGIEALKEYIELLKARNTYKNVYINSDGQVSWEYASDHVLYYE